MCDGFGVEAGAGPVVGALLFLLCALCGKISELMSRSAQTESDWLSVWSRGISCANEQ